MSSDHHPRIPTPRRRTAAVLLTVVLSTAVACSAPASPTLTTTTVSTTTVPVGTEVESAEWTEPVDAAAVDADHWWVTNPSTGSRLWVTVHTPASDPTGAHPVVVMVPGGSSSAQLLFEDSGVAQDLADLGHTVVTFDPEGRGRSDGVEDDNGSDGQDGLAAVLFLADALAVAGDDLTLFSNSFGVTLATGALARWSNLPVDRYLDWEGPSDRDQTGGCDDGVGGHIDHDCDDDAWWSEREAVAFVGSIDVPYVRLQSEHDHVQDSTDHALAMVNAAVAGGVPEVWLNETPVTAPLDAIDAGLLHSDDFDTRVAALVDLTIGRFG